MGLSKTRRSLVLSKVRRSRHVLFGGAGLPVVTTNCTQQTNNIITARMPPPKKMRQTQREQLAQARARRRQQAAIRAPDLPPPPRTLAEPDPENHHSAPAVGPASVKSKWLVCAHRTAEGGEGDWEFSGIVCTGLWLTPVFHLKNNPPLLADLPPSAPAIPTLIVHTENVSEVGVGVRKCCELVGWGQDSSVNCV